MDSIKLIKTPIQAYKLLLEKTDVDVYKKTRVRVVIEHRAFFCYILRKKFKMTYHAIAIFMRKQSEINSYDHATAIHAVRQFDIYKKSSFEYFDKLESHFIIPKHFEYSELSKLLTVQKDYTKALQKINKYEKKIYSNLTDNEIEYRDLDKEQKKQYDERASIVLKSFSWKKPKNEYEIINCGA